MNVLEIIGNIELHKRVYEEAGVAVPPYKIYAEDHKTLRKYLMRLFNANKTCNCPDILTRYMDVEIEVVINVGVYF